MRLTARLVAIISALLAMGLAACSNCAFPEVDAVGDVKVGDAFHLPFDPKEFYACPHPGEEAADVSSWMEPPAGGSAAKACFNAGTFNTSFYRSGQRYAAYVRRGVIVEIHKPGGFCIDT